MILAFPRQTWLSMIAILGLGLCSQTYGQGNTFNPYGNSGYADYREFTTPMYSNDPSLPNQARLQGGLFGGQSTRANQFEAYSKSLDSGEASGFSRGSMAGVPYYKANQLYNRSIGRSGRVTTDADREFQARLDKRNADYMKALEIKDPRKRALELQKIDRDALNQPIASARTRATTPVRSAAARSAQPAVTPGASVPRRTAPAVTETPVAPPAATAPTVNPATVPIPAPR